MDASTAGLLGGLVGLAVGVVSVLAWRVSERQQTTVPAQPESDLPAGASAVLSVLRSSALIVGPGDEVLEASAPAYAMGLVTGSGIADESLREIVHAVRRDGQIRELSLQVRPGSRALALSVDIRAAPLGSRLVLVLAEDRTRERRVEAIRRDFVANVSHELKTPAGAMRLLAETTAEAAEDPAAVRRFAGRMQFESERLTRLVQQIIDLSRLQGDDPLEQAGPVPVDPLIERAVERVRVDADDTDVAVLRTGEPGLTVLGDEEQLSAALGNLVENAVAYSPPGGRVTVTTTAVGDQVEIAVSDHGTGIPAADLDRIFERFYRVDPARARDTGGTGLGLAIVKHVAATHGGQVRVWSVEGAGSTFTVSLPCAPGRCTASPEGLPSPTEKRQRA